MDSSDGEDAKFQICVYTLDNNDVCAIFFSIWWDEKVNNREL